MAAPSLAIEARWQRIDGHPQSHWLLCDAAGAVLAEFHCLARDPGRGGWHAPARPVPPDTLRLVHLVHPGAGFDATIPGLPAPARRDTANAEVISRVEGEAEAIRARWQRAACALPLLNRALEEAIGPQASVDSQSALVALGEWMGLHAPPPWPGRPDDAATSLPPIRVMGAAAADAPQAAPPAPALPTPDPLQQDPLYRQARNAVARMEDGIGRGYDASSERLTRSLVELAQAHGLAGIDHVVLSRTSARTRAGENVFVIRGRLDDPAHQRVAMKTDEALQRGD